MTFEEAKARYVHRYTMEHKPAWANDPAPNGKYYAPQYWSDREWYERTLFPPHNPMGRRVRQCYSTRETWPLGQWLDVPYDGEQLRRMAASYGKVLEAVRLATAKAAEPAPIISNEDKGRN